MLFYSLCALSGLIFGYLVLFNFENMLPIAVALLSLCTLLVLIKKTRNYFIIPEVFLIFSILGNFLIYNESKASVYTDCFVTLTGRVSEIPYQTDTGFSYVIETNALTYGTSSVKFSERVSVYSENSYNLDDTILVSGFLMKHEHAKNPGCFDPYLYYKSTGINYKMTAYSDSVSKLKISAYTPYATAQRIRNFFLIKSKDLLNPDNYVIFSHIIANFKKLEAQDYSNILINSGVYRCLYSPYYHLILLLGIVNFIFKFANPRLRRAAIYIVCIIYLMTNPHHPTGQKLFTLTLISEFIKAHSKISRPLDILFLAIAVCLIRNPYAIYNEGFIMSCIATTLITVFNKKIYGLFLFITRKSAASNIISMLIITLVMSLPASAYLFNGISLYSVLVSFILLPVLLVIYILSPLILIPVFKAAAVFFIEPLLAFIRNLAPFIASLPLSKLTMVKPSIVLVISTFFLLAALGNKKKRHIFICIFTGLALSFTAGEVMRAGKMTITFLNVGQGDCSLIDIPYKSTILVDGGGSAEYNTTYDVGERDVLPYLTYSGIRELDYVFVSHYHKDHADGIVSLIQNIKINNIFLPDCLKENEYRVIIEESAKEKGIKLHYIKGKQTIKLDGGIVAEILYFNKNAEDDNDTSVVMRLSYDDFSCLYTGDITKNVEAELINSDISADVLKAPHHGSKTSNSKEFIMAVNPSFAVASFDKNNNYGILSKETKESYKLAKVPLLTTAEYGLIQITKNNGRIIWQKKMR